MKIIKAEPSGFGSNTYILTADNKNAVVIDPSQTDIADVLKNNGLVCKSVLLTHGHFDHVGGCGVLFEGGAQIYCGEEEKGNIFSEKYLGIFGGVYVPRFEIFKTVRDNERLTLCGIDFRAIHTAGHTAGSMCYIAGNNIFSGDTLFHCGIGRCDLPTGNTAKLLQSLKMLKALEGDYNVYCGHGGDTTLEYERRFNPYLR